MFKGYLLQNTDKVMSLWGARVPWLFRDGDFTKLYQRIADNDYFGTLATHLRMMRDDQKVNVDILQQAEEELVYLQKNYTLSKKEEREILIG
jgi:hypothetical protein